MDTTADCLSNKLFVTIKDAAFVLSISRRSVDYLLATGRLPYKKFGRRTLIPVKALREFSKRDHPSVAPPKTAPPREQRQ